VRVRARLRACGSGTAAQSLIAWLHLGGWDDDVFALAASEGLETLGGALAFASHDQLKLYWELEKHAFEAFPNVSIIIILA